MENINKLYKVFADALDIDINSVNDELQYNAIPQWNSVAHMALIAALEAEFNVMFDTDDVIGMSSVAKAKESLEKNGITF